MSMNQPTWLKPVGVIVAILAVGLLITGMVAVPWRSARQKGMTNRAFTTAPKIQPSLPVPDSASVAKKAHYNLNFFTKRKQEKYNGTKP